MNDIDYRTSSNGINVKQIKGFFVGWDNPPTPEIHLKILENSDHIVLALNGEQVVGYITAITDKTVSAYIPLLEVLPKFQGQGIGKELVKQTLFILKDYYMIDLLCDYDLQSFYEQFGMNKTQGMCLRNYSKQNGAV